MNDDAYSKVIKALERRCGENCCIEKDEFRCLCAYDSNSGISWHFSVHGSTVYVGDKFAVSYIQNKSKCIVDILFHQNKTANVFIERNCFINSCNKKLILEKNETIESLLIEYDLK